MFLAISIQQTVAVLYMIGLYSSARVAMYFIIRLFHFFDIYHEVSANTMFFFNKVAKK